MRRAALLGVAAVLALAAWGGGSVQALTRYAVTPITDQAGIDEAALNANGQLALTVYQGSCCDDGEFWSLGVIRHVPLPAGCDVCGGFGSSAESINGAGQIAGSYSNYDIQSGRDFVQAYRYSMSTNQTTLIPTPVGESSFGHGINGAGQVVGESGPTGGTSHAFLWNGSSVKDLGTFGGSSSVAVATYASGQAVGCAQTMSGRFHPFLYQAGAIRDLGLPQGTTHGCAISVNSAGAILGWSNNGGSTCAAWIWRAGTRTILPKVNGQCIVNGEASNTGFLLPGHGHIANTGQVVGSVTINPATSLPVVYQSGHAAIITGAQTPFDPQSPAGAPNTGWFGFASSNNLHGLISVLGSNENGSNTLYLLTPITIRDETALTFSSGWTRVALAGAYGGHVEQTSSAGKTATLRFTGKSVSVIGVRGPGLGSARVTIDGAARGTLSEAGAAKTRARLNTIYFASPGTHTLRLTVTSGQFKLDAITVAPN